MANSYLAKGGGCPASEIVDVVYPIGSIYMSISNVSPTNLFGGTWEQIKDTFLLSAGDTYSGGSTGGYSRVNHAFYLPPINTNNSQNAGYNYLSSVLEKIKASIEETDGSDCARIAGVENIGGTIGNNSTTGTEVSYYKYTTNNMPPYLTVYMWKRTA